MTDSQRNTSGPKPIYGEKMQLVQTHVPPAVKARLTLRAEVAGKSRAEYLRKLIIDALGLACEP